MAFQPVPNVAEVQLRASMFGIPMENTFYVEYEDEPDEALLQVLVDDVADATLEVLLDGFTPEWHGTEVYARGIGTAIAAQATNTDIDGVAGTNAGTALDAGQSLAIARRSGLTGRSSRGRIFWMSLPFNKLTDNFVDIDHASTLVSFANALHEILNASGREEVIVSRFTNGAPRASGITFPVTEYLVTNRRIDSQRNRRGKE